MIVELKNNKKVLLRQLAPADIDAVAYYLQQLSPASRSRFGPHEYNRDAMVYFYHPANNNTGYLAVDVESGGVVAYAIIKKGCLYDDGLRLQAYGLVLSEAGDCTFAPSVADAWQSCGVGKSMYSFILAQLKTQGFTRVILWAGVQATNSKAISFYNSVGFYRLGQFEHNGLNYDMVSDIW